MAVVLFVSSFIRNRKKKRFSEVIDFLRTTHTHTPHTSRQRFIEPESRIEKMVSWVLIPRTTLHESDHKDDSISRLMVLRFNFRRFIGSTQHVHVCVCLAWGICVHKYMWPQTIPPAFVAQYSSHFRFVLAEWSARGTCFWLCSQIFKNNHVNSGNSFPHSSAQP